jgi:hypothetical protein
MGRVVDHAVGTRVADDADGLDAVAGLTRVGIVLSSGLKSGSDVCSCFCAKTTSWRLNAPPSGVRVVFTLARLFAMTSIARRSAERPDALTSIESYIPAIG